MTKLLRLCLSTAAFLSAAQPVLACQLAFPEGYVEPTNETLIARSQAAFVGHVVAYRLDDGTTIERDIDCGSAEDTETCWKQRQRIITAILAVDIDIRNMGGQPLFEDDRSADAGADCGNEYFEGTVYLVTGFGPKWLAESPNKATIAAWRALPQKRR